MSVPAPQAFENADGVYTTFDASRSQPQPQRPAPQPSSQPVAGPSNYNGQFAIPSYNHNPPQPQHPIPLHLQPSPYTLSAGNMVPSYHQGVNVAYQGGGAGYAGSGYHFGGMSGVPPPMPAVPGEDKSGDGESDATTVKHRRRTTPDQLKVLEFWFEINPKPDNQLREQLAAQLGMTKRNVQVWFQNRRAKVKGIAKKEAEGNKNGSSGDLSSSHTPQDHSYVDLHYPSYLQPNPPHSFPMGRRASLANGEAAKIEMFVAKRAAAQKQEEVLSHVKSNSGTGHGLGAGTGATGTTGTTGTGTGTDMGQANAARRGSIPYPSPATSFPPPPPPQQLPTPMSPKFSPAARAGPSALHIAAIRNNTRRASMPGAPQLISSGPFTPPRVVGAQLPGTGGVGGVVGGRARELSPIRDHEVYGEAESWGFLPPPAEYDAATFLDDSPLPNPTFSFGSAPSNPPPPPPPLQHHSSSQSSSNPQLSSRHSSDSHDEAQRQQQMFMMMQQRGRLGSMASIGTMGTENGTTDGEDSSGEWLVDALPEGFEPDARRASAPADLLHQIGIMGLTPNVAGLNGMSGPVRPSPLNTHFTPDSYHHPYTPHSASSTSTYPMSHPGSDSISNESPTLAQFGKDVHSQSLGHLFPHTQPHGHHQYGQHHSFDGFEQWDASGGALGQRAGGTGTGTGTLGGGGGARQGQVPPLPAADYHVNLLPHGQESHNGSGESEEGKDDFLYLTDFGGGSHDAVNVLV
ncbi:hypothetical protein B9479_008025 [Cryptococcus floricola]|uniref:Homeobox domain-containing protein n=1 Tax=Cryptococcus floricola TaxID=2591691 RepID=A0A5D3AMX5_9TREE|nr:hypothetical protein B9479_008025 [Cryptococcus floricola]